MVHYAYPNVKISYVKQGKEPFLKCGRYVAAEQPPGEGYEPVDLGIVSDLTEVQTVASILAPESFRTTQQVYEIQDDPEAIYDGTSKELAYLLVLINRSRAFNPGDWPGDIWCTGNVGLLEGKRPFLEAVDPSGFTLKLQAFLRQEQPDTLFIIPAANLSSAHETLCKEQQVNLWSLSQFTRRSGPKEGSPQKTLVLVNGNELEWLVRTLFANPAFESLEPYRGLSAFREEDAEFFFGREKLVAELVQAIQKQPAFIITGASGSGKSSLVYAGIIPELKKQGNWLIASFTPQPQPFRELASALIPLLEPEKSVVDQFDEIEKLTNKFEAGTLSLSTVLEAICRKQPDCRILLFADQFEGLYALTGDEHLRQRYLEELLGIRAAWNSGRYTLLLTIRADFLGKASKYGVFAEAFQQASFMLGPMSPEELREVITQPAEQLGVRVEAGLTERLLKDVGAQAERLPLLEFTLTELWKRQQNAALTERAYDDIGGVQQALVLYAENVYHSLSLEKQERTQRIFTTLIEPGEVTEPTGRVVTFSEFEQEDRELLTTLANTRLIVTGSHDAQTPQSESAEETIKIIHDTLITHWQRLREWIDADWNFLTWRKRLRAAVQEWTRVNRHHDALLRGTPLGEAEEWLHKRQDDLSQPEQEYIHTSLRARLQAQRRKKLKITGMFAAAAVIIAILSVSLFYYYYCYVWDHDTYYNTFGKIYGQPVGIGKLSEEQVNLRAVSYKFISKGSKNPVYKVQAVKNTGEVTVPQDRESLLQMGELSVSDAPLAQSELTFSDKPTYIQLASPQLPQQAPKKSQWEYVLDSAKRIVYEKAYDDKDHFVWGLVYSPPPEEKQPDSAFYVNDKGCPYPTGKSLAEFIKIEYSDKGYEKSISYSDLKHNPQPGPDQAYLLRQEFDDDGLVTVWTYFDQEGEPMLHPDGYHKKTAKYDDFGNLNHVAYSDEDGNPTPHKNGYYQVELKYDDRGRRSEVRYLDKERQPVCHENGYHRVTLRYDEHDRRSEVTYLGKEGQPVRHREYGCHKITWEYDEHGNVAKIAFFDKKGEPTLHPDTYHAIIMKYDEDGRQIEQTYLDEHEQPTSHKDGFHKMTTKYDEDGNPAEIAYWGKNEQQKAERILQISSPVETGQRITVRVHKMYMQHDRHGDLIEVAYRDSSDQPASFTVSSDDDQTTEVTFTPEKFTMQYNERHIPLEGILWGKSDQTAHNAVVNMNLMGVPVALKTRFSRMIYKFDEHSKPIETTFVLFNEETPDAQPAGQLVIWDKPIDVKFGFHKIIQKINEHGKRTDIAFFEENGQRTHLSFDFSFMGFQGEMTVGFHAISYKYDERGNLSEQAFFDTKGQPTHLMIKGLIADESITCLLNFYKVVTKYDERNRPVEYTFFDTHDQPARGISRIVTTYNNHGKLVELAFFDENSYPSHPFVNIETALPGQMSLDFHKVTLHYDEQDRFVEAAFFDQENQPCQPSYTVTISSLDDTMTKKETSRIRGGFHRLAIRYNKQGNMAESEFFDTENTPIRHVLFDEDHHILSELQQIMQSFGGAGNLVEQITSSQWNDVLKIVTQDSEVTYFDNTGNPTNNEHGIHQVLTEYNWHGKMTERAGYDLEGHVIQEEHYDEQGRIVERTRYDRWGNTLKNTRYDESGNAQYDITAYFNEAGEPAQYEDGFHKAIVKYDDHGKPIERTYFDENGQPTNDKQGIHKVLRKYDEQENMVEETKYDRWGNLLQTTLYDEQGKRRKVITAYFNEADKPIQHDDGFHTWVIKYDKHDKPVEWTFFDENGQPARHREYGCHKVIREFDTHGNIIKITFFDERDQPTPHKNGYYAIIAKYDENGNQIERTYFDENDHPTNDRQGIHQIIWKYDEQDHMVEETKYDRWGNLRQTTLYDEQGKRREETIAYFNERGESIQHEAGFHQFTTKYNQDGKPIEQAYFDETGKPTLYKGDYHRIILMYDEDGNVIFVRKYDEHQNLIK